jgi:hypothetical protein
LGWTQALFLEGKVYVMQESYLSLMESTLLCLRQTC